MSLDNYERLLDPTMHLSKAKWNKEVQILDDVKRKILKTDPGILEKEINRELKHTKKKHYKMIKREEVKGEIVLFINFPGCICY